tara:strand:+ start:100 stop:315 length:216 start_codon:yes stop_codon:yes gene_type:complete
MNISLTKHPNKNGMSYFQHLIFSLKFFVYLFIATIKALIHAFLPFLFETSTGDVIKQINKCMKDQHSKTSK